MPNQNELNISNINNTPYIYTKRTCSDNSETFITSKLNLLYKKTLTSRNMLLSKHSLKKMLNESYGAGSN